MIAPLVLDQLRSAATTGAHVLAWHTSMILSAIAVPSARHLRASTRNWESPRELCLGRQRSGLRIRTSSRGTFRAHLLCVRVATGDPNEIQLTESPKRLATNRELERRFLHGAMVAPLVLD